MSRYNVSTQSINPLIDQSLEVAVPKVSTAVATSPCCNCCCCNSCNNNCCPVTTPSCCNSCCNCVCNSCSCSFSLSGTPRALRNCGNGERQTYSYHGEPYRKSYTGYSKDPIMSDPNPIRPPLLPNWRLGAPSQNLLASQIAAKRYRKRYRY